MRPRCPAPPRVVPAVHLMRTLSHPLHSGSLSWLPLLPCCAPPPCLPCSPFLLVWLPRPVCCSSPCLLVLLGAPFAHPLLSHPPAPRTRISRLRMTLTVPRAVGWSQPCCHPRGGHLPARGAQPPPLWSSRAPRRGRGGLVCGWLAGRAPHLVVAAVPPVHCCESCWGSSHCRVWGSPVPSCFATCDSPNLALFFLLLAHSPPLVCECALPGGGRMSLPTSR